MIVSFACRETESLFYDGHPKRLPADIIKTARRKLMMIHAAHAIRDLEVPPGNRLELLKGDRRGQYSVRINDKWRICFRFQNGQASDVEITDYH